MVTSFRPRNYQERDDTVLTTVRPISNLHDLYGQFAEYRLEIMEERVRAQLRALREAKAGGKPMATAVPSAASGLSSAYGPGNGARG